MTDLKSQKKKPVSWRGSLGGYVSVKRGLKEEWDQLSEQGQIKIKSMLGEKAEPPAEEFLHKIEMLADFCEQSEGFNIC